MMTFFVRGVYLLAAAVCLSSLFVGESDAALLVEASFNDTRCGDGGAVCPNDPLLFTCTVTDSMTNLATVRLPSGVEVNIRNGNTTSGEGDLPAGVAIQSANAIVNGDLRNYTLSLAFGNASLLNGSVICDAQSASNQQNAICLIANGPDAPVDLAQDVSLNTESSAVVQWRAPVSTGGSGVSISRYDVTVEGQMSPQTVGGDGRDVFTHTISVPEFNTSYSVSVTAINSCGLSSQPATTSVYIEARVPPLPKSLSVVLECDAPLNAGRPITISWMNGGREVGVVYPNERATVVLTPEGTVCSDVTGTSCAANITSDGNHTASLTLSNDVSSSTPVSNAFNSIPLSAEIINSEPPRVRISLNVLCNSNITYEINVLFGVQMENEESCQYQNNITRVVSPMVGNDSLDIPVEFGKAFCYKAILKADSETVFEISGSGEATPPTTEPPTTSNTVAIIVGCVVAVILVSAVAVALIAVFFCAKRNRNKGKSQQAIPLSATTGPGSPDPDSAEAGPMYQEPNTISRSAHPETGELYTDINLKTKRSEQDPSSIEHQEAPSGDVYAMPQKKTEKKGKKGRNEEPEEGLTEEEKAALYSVPDRKTQKAKSAGLTYADVVIQPSSKPAPPPQGSTYADIKYN